MAPAAETTSFSVVVIQKSSAWLTVSLGCARAIWLIEARNKHNEMRDAIFITSP
jgi:hypothetical protein